MYRVIYILCCARYKDTQQTCKCVVNFAVQHKVSPLSAVTTITHTHRHRATAIVETGMRGSIGDKVGDST